MGFRCPFCKCVLKIEKGEPVGHQFRIKYPRTTIGRGKDNIVQIDDPYVSRSHCELTFIDGKLELTDNNSTGGTRLNGLPVNRAIILPRDTLKIGQTKLRFDCRMNFLFLVCRFFDRLMI